MCGISQQCDFHQDRTKTGASGGCPNGSVTSWEVVGGGSADMLKYGMFRMVKRGKYGTIRMGWIC